MTADNARLLFIDGPLSLYIREAEPQEILDAYERLGRLVKVAAAELNKEKACTEEVQVPPTPGS